MREKQKRLPKNINKTPTVLYGVGDFIRLTKLLRATTESNEFIYKIVN